MKVKKVFDTSQGRVLFCSDLHYDHSNILLLNQDTRSQWSSVEEMNNYLKEYIWGELRPGDTLFDFGDTFWKVDTKDIIPTLENCKRKGAEIWKIIGNHDSYGLYYPPASTLVNYFAGIGDILDITVRHEGKDYMLSLSHYPMVSWNHKPYGSFMIHGHCHGHTDEYNESTPDLRVDVGIDGKLCHSLGKVMLDFSDILDYFTKKTGGLDFRKYVKLNSYNL